MKWRAKLAAQIGTEVRSFKLVQVWSDLHTRDTFYLATEDGKIMYPEACSNIREYTDPLHALLIIRTPDDQTYTFDARFCKGHRRPLLWLDGARIPMSDIEEVTSQKDRRKK